MKCHVCGGKLEHTVTSLPFRVSNRSILIIKELPVFECLNCTEFFIEHDIMARVEEIIGQVDESAELEVVHFAA